MCLWFYDTVLLIFFFFFCWFSVFLESPLLSEYREGVFNTAMKYFTNRRKTSQLFMKAFVWNVQ